jgi:hypothetical protein
MVGQYLKTDVSPTGSIQLGSIGASQLSVGINPLIFRKYLAFHRLNPFVVDLLKKISNVLLYKSSFFLHIVAYFRLDFKMYLVNEALE